MLWKFGVSRGRYSTWRKILLPSFAKTSCNTLFSIGSQHIQTASMSAVAQDENKIEMSNHEKFLFDLNGFIVLRNVLNEEEVQQLNDAIDANIHKAVTKHPAGMKSLK